MTADSNQLHWRYVVLVLLMLQSSWLGATQDNQVGIDSLKNFPGKLIALDGFQIHMDCRGDGDVTVLFESGLGGSSLEWQAVQQLLGDRSVKTCSYDRAGYAWSEPSAAPRHAQQLALEADRALTQLNIPGPLILVGHSFGGLVVRLLAQLRQPEMVGMVLVDASHEDQLELMEKNGGPSVMPTGGNFVISAFNVAEDLPEDIKGKAELLIRTRKNYVATHREMSYFRESTRQVKFNRKQIDFPLVVLRRGKDPHKTASSDGEHKNAIWKKLQEDLATISSRGVIVVAANSGHHVHIDEPGLVSATIEEMLDEYERSNR